EVNHALLVPKSGPATIISWTDSPGPFNVYRGTRRTGLPWAYNQGCLVMGDTMQSAPDPLMPDPGITFFYLVTRIDSCGESIPGRDSNGAPIPNNAARPTTGNDADGDGHIDQFDHCPFTPTADQADVDAPGPGDGCAYCTSTCT